MNKLLRMMLICALGTITVNTMAQVERQGARTELDATWTEVSRPSATSDGDLHLSGNSTVYYTMKNTSGSRDVYSFTATIEVRSKKGDLKAQRYYKVSNTLSWGKYSMKWTTLENNSNWVDVTNQVKNNCLDGQLDIENGETGDYVYVEINGGGSYILTSLSTSTTRYDLYDHVGLFGEDTGTEEADIKSNRIKDHNSIIDVYVHRSIAGNGAWSTLCLPFDLDDYKVKKAFGDNIVYAAFDNVNLAKKEIHFKSTTNGMKAGRPYLIQNNGNEINNFFADDVTFTKSGIEGINKAGRKSTKTSEGYYFVGLLEPTKVNDNGDASFNPQNRAVYIANPNEEGKQQLKKLSDNGIIKAFRAYLYFPMSDTEVTHAKESTMFLCLDDLLDGGVTGVGNINVDGKPVNNTIYNLNGQSVGTDSNVLPKGVYVRNGKKFVVK